MRVRALIVGSFLSLLFASHASVACAQERDGLPVALDFTPIGEAPLAATHAAPADVNFGVYPLSIMGIENAIRRADAKVDAYATGVERWDTGPIAYTVVAIRDWERRYPRDPWIAKDLLALAKFYAHVGTAESRADAARAAAWLRHDYPGSEYATAAALAVTQAEPER